MKLKTQFITQAGIVAALYVVLTMLSNAFGLASGAIQVRVSEALCMLPIFFPAAIPGLFIGCLLSNILTGCLLWDVILGSLATLIGAVGTYYLRKKPVLAFIPPILANVIIVPIVLCKIYAIEYEVTMIYPVVMLTVFIGELISVGIFGAILYKALGPAIKRLTSN